MRLRGKLIGAVLVAAVALAVGGFAVMPRLAHRQITVTAHFEDAVGLYAGNAVALLGMQVGKVTSIIAKDNYVEVKLAIDDRVDIPAEVQAVTVSTSILTDRHVELTPPDAGDFGLEVIDGCGDNSEQSAARIRSAIEALQTLPFFGGKLVWLKNANCLGDSVIGRSAAAQDALAELAEVR